MRFAALVLVVACHDVQETRVLTVPPLATGSATPGAIAPSTPPPFTITVMTPGAFEIENTTGAPVTLGTRASIEREDGTLLNLDLGRGLRLVEQCPQTEPDRCVVLPAHATLRPVPWSGFDCSAQCNKTCRANNWEGGGKFRFVVRTCDSVHTVTTPSFTVPRDSRPGPFARQSITTDIVSATVARLELPSQQFALGAPASRDHIAGFRVKPGTEKPIDKTLADAFALLVQNENGFDDEIAKRCLMTDLVGVRLVRHPPTTGPMKEDVVEIAFDQTCSKFFAVRGDTSHRVEMATHYDPQRPAFLAWAKRAVP